MPTVRMLTGVDIEAAAGVAIVSREGMTGKLGERGGW